jgi:hypothetical protein
MPLTVTPLPITLAAPQPSSPPLASAVAAPNPLPVPQIPQRAEEWCWAACVQMVLALHRVNLQQCDVVGRQFNQNCCATPDDPPCNQPLSVWSIAAAYNSWQLGAELITSPVQFNYLLSEINAGRPVEVGFLWMGGGGHAALVRGAGMTSSGPVVLVNDPKYGTGSVYYANLLSAYSLGSWQYTWVAIG